MSDSFVLSWIRWHYGLGTKGLIRILFNFIEFALHMFSVPQLLPTIFSPWKGIGWQAPGKAWYSSATFEAISGNIISRVLGAMVRSVMIILGVLLAVFVAVCCVILLAAWLLAPVIIVWLFIQGIRLLF